MHVDAGELVEKMMVNQALHQYFHVHILAAELGYK